MMYGRGPFRCMGGRRAGLRLLTRSVPGLSLLPGRLVGGLPFIAWLGNLAWKDLKSPDSRLKGIFSHLKGLRQINPGAPDAIPEKSGLGGIRILKIEKSDTGSDEPLKGMNMKIVFTTSGTGLDAPLDSRFGRAPKFLVYDTETRDFEVLDNRQNLNSPQGAGIQSALTVVKTGATHLVTGHCGPKAFKVLKAAGIAILNTDAPTIAEALERFLSDRLTPVESADVEGHWA